METVSKQSTKPRFVIGSATQLAPLYKPFSAAGTYTGVMTDNAVRQMRLEDER